MSVVLDASESNPAKLAMIEAIKKDPVKAIEFLIFSGQFTDEKSATDYVNSIVNKIEHAEENERLADYYKSVSSDIRGLVETFDVPDPKIVYMTITVTYDAAINGETKEPFGWMCGNVKHKLDGEIRLSGGASKKSTGGGNGKKAGRVPTPDGYSSWKKYLEDVHPEEAAKQNGAYSAPRILEKLNDPVFMDALNTNGREPAVEE